MRSFSHLPMIVCSLALSGCVAAPLAQMAVSQLASPKPGTTETTTSTFISLSQGISDSFHKMTGPDSPQASVDKPPK